MAPQLTLEHYDAAAGSLDDLTTQAGEHPKDPKQHLHLPATKEKAHAWMKSVFPYTSLEEFESQWHLGNYVYDRETHQKEFESMSVCLLIPRRG